MGSLSGKKGVILGVGNQRSIAWAVAEHFHEQGAELALTYLSDPKGRFEANVRKLGDKVNASLIQECDVSNDDSIQSLIGALNDHWGELDFLIHSLAFADQKDLQVDFSSTSRGGYAKAHEISAFSLLPLAKGVIPMMKKRGGGSIPQYEFHRLHAGSSALSCDGSGKSLSRSIFTLSGKRSRS